MDTNEMIEKVDKSTNSCDKYSLMYRGVKTKPVVNDSLCGCIKPTAKGVVIGICGKPGSGKDTVGLLLTTIYGFGKVDLKYPIEETVKVIFGIDDAHLYDRKLREEPLEDWPGWTTRKLLQETGQKMREIFGDEIWAKSLCKRVSYNPNKSKICISDIRTPVDAAYIRQQVQLEGGTFILMMVKRPGCGATTLGGFTNHILESYDLEPECDIVFNNEDSIPELHKQVISFLRKSNIYEWRE